MIARNKVTDLFWMQELWRAWQNVTCTTIRYRAVDYGLLWWHSETIAMQTVPMVSGACLPADDWISWQTSGEHGPTRNHCITLQKYLVYSTAYRFGNYYLCHHSCFLTFQPLASVQLPSATGEMAHKHIEKQDGRKVSVTLLGERKFWKFCN